MAGMNITSDKRTWNRKKVYLKIRSGVCRGVQLGIGNKIKEKKIRDDWNPGLQSQLYMVQESRGYVWRRVFLHNDSLPSQKLYYSVSSRKITTPDSENRSHHRKICPSAHSNYLRGIEVSLDCLPWFPHHRCHS